jgi:hypothetical protein
MLEKISSLEKKGNLIKLIELLNDNDTYVQRAAAFSIGQLALRKISDIKTVQPLFKLLNNEDPHTQINALFSLTVLANLGLYEGKDEIHELVNKLQNGDMVIKHRLIHLIGILVENSVITDRGEIKETMQNILKTEENSDIQRKIIHVIEILDQQMLSITESKVFTQDKNFTPALVPNTTRRTNEVAELLDRAISLHVPQFMDSNTTSEILVELNNTSATTLTDISIDTSQLEEDFEVTGTVAVKTLNPGKALEQRIKIKPRYEKGTFPVKIIIMAKGARVTREYSIKVGGTEIY